MYVKICVNVGCKCIIIIYICIYTANVQRYNFGRRNMIKFCLFLLLYVPCQQLWSLRVGVTIAGKNDYCDSIDIAGSTIAILLLLWTTIAILL